MNKVRIAKVHAVAAQKGLDEEFYRLNLQAVGVSSCLAMKESHYRAFMQRMKRLPDAPGRVRPTRTTQRRPAGRTRREARTGSPTAGGGPVAKVGERA
jgi:hypothetical protein